MKAKTLNVLIGAAAAAMLIAAPASAQFYKGKRVTMLINYGAGGPTDIEARIVAKHLPKHIAGEPRIIVKNMGGGGGMIASNYLGEVAKPDGMTFGFFTWNVLAGMIGDPGLRVKYDKFGFIAGIANPVVFYARKDTAPGLKTGDDLMKASGFKACSLNARNTNTIHQVLAYDMLGLKYKPVPGYKGLKAVEGAVLKGECQAANTSLPGWKGSIQGSMGKDVVAIFQLVAPDDDGKITRADAISDIPTFEEFYAKHKGGKPSGMQYDALRQIVDAFMAMFRTTFAAPGAPKESTAALRASFTSLWKDKAFLADYSKRVKNTPKLIVGDAGEKRIKALSNIDPKMAKFFEAEIARLSK
jgi:tripartite-type tricarboxylate transporter receptor subunit TctC